VIDITGKWLHDELRDAGAVTDEHWIELSTEKTMALDRAALGIESQVETEIEGAREEAYDRGRKSGERYKQLDIDKAEARIKELETELAALKGQAAE
jgi:hypothetical protein